MMPIKGILNQPRILQKHCTDEDAMQAVMIHIRGLVQGVGFRPFVYRTAYGHGIEGWVKNTTDGVHVKAVGTPAHLTAFIDDITQNTPVVADISDLLIMSSQKNGESGFHIISSANSLEEVTEVSPDIAVCPDCLLDMDQQPHRENYLLINCTNCGPRFSIIRDIPYDRQHTSMAGFTMCSKCSAEYHNILDRRFHAQPTGCHDCGPQYTLVSSKGKQLPYKDIAKRTARFLDKNQIIAIKGNGGFHLACNAFDTATVNRLRFGKLREGKPFAVMFPSVETLKQYAFINEHEQKILCSWKRPIVLLKSKNRLPATVTAGLTTVGAILPYMPFHHQLFKYLGTKAIVLTSGNMSETPIAIDRNQAFKTLFNVFDYLVDYNRDIYNRTDDSVIQIVNKNIQIIRRSRGYVPRPIRLDIHAEGILATGSELKNCFCFGKGHHAIMSQHIGDLKNLETFNFFLESLHKAKRLFRFVPEQIATDLHPNFLTTEWSRKQGLTVEYVQHHHAHIASCMAENQIHETVIGLCYDGTGYGTDGHMWGGEIMVCDLERFKRVGHFEYLPIPGGDIAIHEPWRMALGCLYKTFGREIPETALSKFSDVEETKIELVLAALNNDINIAQTSGVGRLFDTVASLLGLCSHSAFEAEGPMRLEAIINRGIHDSYHTTIDADGTITVSPIIRDILEDQKNNIHPGVIAARFHNTIIEASVKAVIDAQNKYGTMKVVLSGGSFQNKYLLSGITKRLQAKGLQVLTNVQVPVNDGGIALGQLAVAAARRGGELNC